ncbi:SRPBCC family protein [Paenibacillus baekrokdamisoli]|nr:SRPBCC family protein [Paenibacillus baekrokdamisoli]
MLQTEIEIKVPLECCFDLARNIDIHMQTVWKFTKERAIAGRTTGMIEDGEHVTFEATHFLIRQQLRSKIVEFHRPFIFVDQMVSGAFKTLRHSHTFTAVNHSTTLMKDELIFEAPYGFVGRFVEVFILKRYMRSFLNHRNKQLKLLAERTYNYI